MQEFMRITLSIELFALCLAGGMWFFGSELGIIAIQDRSLDLETLEHNYNTTAHDYQTSPFNITLIFGDFGRAITNFMSAVASNDIQNLIQRWGLAQSFLFIVIVILGFCVVCTLIYLVSGRG
jgi:hypothetical protein